MGEKPTNGEQISWWSVREAADILGYTHHISLNNRIRQLRQQGYVVDWGNPPKQYPVSEQPTNGKIILNWLNSQLFVIRSDAPRTLLNAKRGKRRKK